MQPPLPGMDPYLEAPDLWPDEHASLAFAIRDQIQPLLSPRYDLRIDYRQAPPPPALPAEDAALLDAHLRARGLR